MAKLFKNAQKVKTVLSANKETKAQVEGLFNEIDFKTMISREQVEDMTKDLFDRVAGPINDVRLRWCDPVPARRLVWPTPQPTNPPPPLARLSPFQNTRVRISSTTFSRNGACAR